MSTDRVHNPSRRADPGANSGRRPSQSLSDLWTPDDEPQTLEGTRDLGQVLLDDQVITPAQIDSARKLAQRSPGKSLADIFCDLSVEETVVQKAVARLAGLPFERVEPDQIDAALHIERLGLDFCHNHGVLPLRSTGSRVVLGVTDPDNLLIIDEARHKLGAAVKPIVVCRCDINSVVQARKHEDASETTIEIDDIIADIDEDDVEVVETKEEDLDLEKIAGESPVIRFVNYLIFNAVKDGASDIHIEPQEKNLQVRYRIDGVLFEAMNPPSRMHAAMISRLKIMANLDIAERRIPQDGRIRVVVHGRNLDLRVSTLPTAHGEKAVLRILDTRTIEVDLDELGMGEDALLMWKHQISQPHGILLVTGPTGSGKTTTLYASLGQMERNQLNISTVEDPVEYHLGGINQVQTYDKIGMTFAMALREQMSDAMG